MVSTRFALGLLALLGCHRESPPDSRPDASAPSAPPRNPTAGLTVTGTPFVPRSAYVVGPVKEHMVTLVVSQNPQGDCSAVSSTGALTARLGYGDRTSINVVAKYSENHMKAPDLTGIEPFIHLDVEGHGRFLSGYVAAASVPLVVPTATKAVYDLDIGEGQGLTIKGEVLALVCVSQADIGPAP